MLVEEVPKSSSANNSIVYFTSSINLTARPRHLNQSPDSDESGVNRGSKNRPKLNYNVNKLMHAQTQISSADGNDGPVKSIQQVQIERMVQKRLNDLNRDSTSAFDLPKSFSYLSPDGGKSEAKSRQGNTPTTKRILSSRRNLSSYFEEEKNLISINSILNTNYQFVEQAEFHKAQKTQKLGGEIIRNRLKLCCICGLNSNYTRCRNCGLFTCRIKCNRLHEESRCN